MAVNFSGLEIQQALTLCMERLTKIIENGTDKDAIGACDVLSHVCLELVQICDEDEPNEFGS